MDWLNSGYESLMGSIMGRDGAARADSITPYKSSAGVGLDGYTEEDVEEAYKIFNKKKQQEEQQQKEMQMQQFHANQFAQHKASMPQNIYQGYQPAQAQPGESLQGLMASVINNRNAPSNPRQQYQNEYLTSLMSRI